MIFTALYAAAEEAALRNSTFVGTTIAASDTYLGMFLEKNRLDSAGFTGPLSVQAKLINSFFPRHVPNYAC